MNPGPPFAVGDEVLCDADEVTYGGLFRALVMEADHPRYVLLMKNG